MKKIYLTTLLFSVFSFGNIDLSAHPSGSNFSSNYSGLTGTTCNTSGCHTGGSVNTGPGSVVITTNIPASGYAWGATYQITVTVSSGGTNGVLYGFACSAAKDGTSTLTGGFATADGTTLIKSGGNYIVHNTAAAGNGNPSHSFTFNWTAPVGGTGSVKFYAAGNSANGDGDNSGDQIYNSTLTVNEMPGFGLTESIISAFNLYPNPASEFVNVNVPEGLLDSQVRLMDITGKTIVSQQLNQTLIQLDINLIPAGIYVVEILKDGKSYTSRLIKE